MFKFVTDPTSRVAEIESGGSDVTFEIPYEEFDRLKSKPGLAGQTKPVSDIAMIFITDIDPMLDRNVRLAANHAIDKKAIVDRLLKGYGVPIATLEAPGYAAFDPSIKVAYDPELAKSLLAKSGYSPEKPVKFTIQTTRGFKPKDYEMIQAIVGMWRKVGIDATIEVYEIAQHFELRARHALAPAAFYNWGNAIGDPSTSTGFAMFGPSPHCAWKGKDLVERIGPLWGEKDEAKRIAGYKAVDKYIAEEGEVIPLFQYVQPIIHKKGLKVVAQSNGMILPQLITSGLDDARRGQHNDALGRDRQATRPHTAHAVRRGGDRLRAAARRAGRPHRHDDSAGRVACRHRHGCARSMGSISPSCSSSSPGLARR